jgi:RES domain-containing protein
MLEILAHANIGRIPETHQYVIVVVPDEVSKELLEEDALPQGWDSESTSSAKAFGDRWINEARSSILIVPSVIARLDRNALVNPLYPDAKKLIFSEPSKVIWDKRLFQ